MPSQPQVSELLLRWDERRQQGQPISAEELCRDCPELLAEVQERIHALEEVERLATVASANTPPASADPHVTQEEPFLALSRRLLAPAQQPDELGRLGPYRVLKVLGAGGMGVVFQAEDPQLQRLVALKILLPGLVFKTDARQRFLQEARAAAAIEHDHIVPIYQVGEDQDIPYLAMQYLRGESLEARLRRPGKLPLAEVCRIGREIAEGLAAAHAKGLTHRDIKPANIWLEEGRGRVKILDFGLARLTEEARLSQGGSVAGTPGYMAPEQLRGERADARSDLFALGCVLYALTTSQAPFTSPDPGSMLLAVALQHPPPPRERDAAVPAALSALVMQLLAKRREDRPASARVVADALTALAAAPTKEPPVLASVPQPAVAADEATAVLPRHRAVRGWRWRWPLVAAGLLLLVGGIWAGGQFLFRTKDGNGPAPSVTLPERSPLDALDPAQIPEDERRPWHPQELVAILGEQRQRFASGIQDFALSPDGKWIAAVSPNSGQVLLFDTATMRLHWEVVNASVGGWPVAFSPDSRILVTRGKLWDLNGPQPHALEHAPPSNSCWFASAPGGNRLAGGGFEDGMVYLWDWKDGKLTKRYSWKAHDGGHRVAIAPDGKTLVTGDGKTAKVWDVSGSEPKARATLEAGWPFTLAPNGLTLATHKKNGIALWDLSSFQPREKRGLKAVILPYEYCGLAFAPDGESLAVALPGRIELWSVAGSADKPLATVASACSGVTFALDGKTLYGRAYDSIHVFDVAGDRLTERRQLRSRVASYSFSLDGAAIVTSNSDPDGISWWDLTGPAPEERPFPALTRGSYLAGFGRRGVRLALPDRVCEWDGNQTRTLAEWRNPQNGSVRVSTDGRTLAYFPFPWIDQKPEIWGLSDGKATRKAAFDTRVTTGGGLLTPDGKSAVFFPYPGPGHPSELQVQLWSLVGDTWKESWRCPIPSHHDQFVLSSRGDRLALVHRDGQVSVWAIDQEPPRQVHLLHIPGGDIGANGLALSPDGRLFLAGFSQGGVALWDLETGQVLRRWPLVGRATGVQFAPDGRHVAISMEMGVVYILRLKTADGKPYGAEVQ
jgi:WD40 repeat protein